MFSQMSSKTCGQCGRKGDPPSRLLQRCTRCKIAFYCNSECQKAHYKKHRTICKKVAAIPKDKKREFQFDYDNMSKEDWARLSEITARVQYLLDALDAFDYLAKRRPKPDESKAVVKDIIEHRDYWFEEVFHVLEASQNPSKCEMAVIVLMEAVRLYHVEGNESACREAYDVYMQVRECLRKQLQENPIFGASEDQKQRFLRYPTEYPGVHHNPGGEKCSCDKNFH